MATWEVSLYIKNDAALLVGWNDKIILSLPGPFPKSKILAQVPTDNGYTQTVIDI